MLKFYRVKQFRKLADAKSKEGFTFEEAQAYARTLPPDTNVQWVYSDWTGKWHPIGPDDKDYNWWGIPNRRFLQMTEEEALQTQTGAQFIERPNLFTARGNHKKGSRFLWENKVASRKVFADELDWNEKGEIYDYFKELLYDVTDSWENYVNEDVANYINENYTIFVEDLDSGEVFETRADFTHYGEEIFIINPFDRNGIATVDLREVFDSRDFIEEQYSIFLDDFLKEHNFYTPEIYEQIRELESGKGDEEVKDKWEELLSKEIEKFWWNNIIRTLAEKYISEYVLPYTNGIFIKRKTTASRKKNRRKVMKKKSNLNWDEKEEVFNYFLSEVENKIESPCYEINSMVADYINSHYEVLAYDDFRQEFVSLYATTTQHGEKVGIISPDAQNFIVGADFSESCRETFYEELRDFVDDFLEKNGLYNEVIYGLVDKVENELITGDRRLDEILSSLIKELETYMNTVFIEEKARSLLGDLEDVMEGVNITKKQKSRASLFGKSAVRTIIAEKPKKDFVDMWVNAINEMGRSILDDFEPKQDFFEWIKREIKSKSRNFNEREDELVFEIKVGDLSKILERFSEKFGNHRITWDKRLMGFPFTDYIKGIMNYDQGKVIVNVIEKLTGGK